MGFLDRLKAAVIPDYSDLPRPGGEPRGGLAARATIVGTSGSLSGTETVRWSGKTLDLQLVERPEQRAKVDCYFSEREFLVAITGAEIPVRVHESTGVILGVDYDAWTAEVDTIHASRGGASAGYSDAGNVS
jgi:hypothetical protein